MITMSTEDMTTKLECARREIGAALRDDDPMCLLHALGLVVDVCCEMRERADVPERAAQEIATARMTVEYASGDTWRDRMPVADDAIAEAIGIMSAAGSGAQPRSGGSR